MALDVLYSGAAFRRSILQYTGGRLINALMAFFVFVWVASYLPEQHYANYIAAFACIELTLVIFGFGMEWVTAIFIPQFRLNSDGKMLNRFIWSCAGIQMGLLLIGSVVLMLLVPFLVEWLQVEHAIEVFSLYALVMFVEGLSRVFRDQFLSCLLLQGASQISQMARNLTMLAFAYLLSEQLEWRTASSLAIAELCASGLSLLLAMTFLHRYLIGIRENPASDSQWRPPSWRSMLHAGRSAWLSNLINLTWGGHAVILLVTRTLGPESTAAFGFARNLSEQVRRYLPMEFLFGIIRTLVISRFSQDGDAHRLSIRIHLMYRANLIFLLPLLILAVVRGEELCALLSSGRYAGAHWYLVGWLIVLMIWAHHRLSDLLAHSLGRHNLTSHASLKLLATPILLVAAAYSHSWFFIFLTLAIVELSYSILVLVPLGIYRPNWSALAKLLFAALPIAAILNFSAWQAGIASLLIQIVFIFILLLALAVFTRAWSTEEAEIIFPRKSFRFN
jgi:O-antigen/teichoic acid export membrane protein